MEDFKQRLLAEEKDLADKVAKLQNFIDDTNSNFRFIKSNIQDLMKTQLSDMQGYLWCLSERINLLDI